MKKQFGRPTHARFTAAAFIFSCLILVATSVYSEQLKEAKVTQVVQDVKLLPHQAAPRPAAVNDPVHEGTAVRTGTQSRSELTFNDLTITRLGANTIFSFNEGTRTMNLSGGAILFQVPKGSGGATIKTAAVTAAITGTTGIGEFHPATATSRLLSKWLCLEGTFHVSLPDGQSVELGPGKMVSTDGRTFSKVLPFDIRKLMRSSLLVNGFDTPLASLDLILIEEQRQLGDFVTVADLNDPTRIIEDIDQGMGAQQLLSSSPTPTPITPTPTPITPTPTPGKFGTPPVIAADPYVIDQNTTIRTDPTITKNGVTDFGKIYRGREIDGLASAYLFGSTSAFDTASGFDDQIGTGTSGNNSGAVFKFTSLRLIGDPMISTTGGEINLGLIGVNGITSGGPGATLTFAGIRGLLLATQNGSINLGSEISFSGLHDITFYARGAGSSLTLACAISTLSQMHLYSEGAVNLSGNMNTVEFTSFSGGDFNMTGGSLNAETISIISNANVNFSLDAPLAFETTSFLLQSAGNMSIGNSLQVNQTGNGQTEGLNISLLAGDNVNIGGDLRLTTDASNVDSGGNIVVTSGGNMTIGGTFQLLVVADSDSTTGTGGNITVHSGGSLTAGSLDFDLDFNNSVGVTNGVNLTLTVAGDLTTTSGGVDLILFTPIAHTLTSGGNLTMTIGGDLDLFEGSDLNLTVVNTVSTTVPTGANLLATIGGDLNANAISAQIENDEDGGIGTGGNLTLHVGGDVNASTLLLQISNTSGGNITNGGNIALNIGGDLNKTGSATLSILNNDGHIGTGGNIVATVSGDVNGGDLNATIDNSGGGSIDNGGNITLHINGNVTVGALALLVDNHNGGTIDTGGNIAFTTGGNLTADSIDAQINNRNGGLIDSLAHLDFSVAGTLSTEGDATFGISNRNDGEGGGSIEDDARVNIHANSISVGGFLTSFISANAGGDIGTSAQIQFNVTGALHSGAGMFFDVEATAYNSFDGGFIAPGNIGSDALINVTAGSITSDGFLEADIFDRGGHIGRDAIITFTSGAISAHDDAVFTIGTSDNPDGTPGTIGRDAKISLAAASLSSTNGGLFAQIQNERGGSIGGDASILFNVSGAITTQGQASFLITNFDDDDGNGGGTIGGDATINITAGSLSASSLLAQIDSNGGLIEGTASITLNLGGALTTTGDATFRILSGIGKERPSGGILPINVAVNSMNIGGSLVAGVFLDGSAIDRSGVLVHATNDIIVGDQINVEGSVTAGGNISAVNGITFGGSLLSAGGNITSSAGSIGQDFDNQGQSGTIFAGGNISAAGFVASFPGISALGSITASSLFANTVSTGTDIVIRALGGGVASGIFVDSVSVGGALILMNAQQVRANGAHTDGSIGFTPNDFFLSVDSIMSTGPTFPILTSDGESADPNIGNDNPGNGGNIAVNLNADGLTIGAGGDLDHIEANGGDYHVPSTRGGNAGTVSILATGDVTLNDGINGTPAITTYTGFIPTGGAFTLGDGGTVSIETPGTVTVNSTIEVSSNDTPGLHQSPNGITPAGRRSARGGNINLTSHKSSQAGRAVAINVTSSSQLLSLLNAAAPGPGGTITILATGANTDVNVKGRVQADRGTIDIRHNASGGHVALGDASANSIDMRADVVKVGAFGANGQLIVGGGALSADTILKLYAPGSNGEINFIANVTLSAGSATILAGDTITIQPTRLVTIAGNGGPAQVFTNNANYSGFGGNNPNNGTFGGNGANNPLPLDSRPPFSPGGH